MSYNVQIFFSKMVSMKNHSILLILFFLIASCATYRSKYGPNEQLSEKQDDKELVHRFFLIGDAGKSAMGEPNAVLKLLKEELGAASENTTTIFLGDNIYPAGMPDPKEAPQAYSEAANNLDAQLGALANYKGQPIFIPGNHDWYSNGLDGLERQQLYIQEKLQSEEVFFPENGCPIKKIDINKEIVVIAIDTEWYLVNWDKHPTINDDCEIRDREAFFEELESLIKKNSGKTTILAMHHPMFTYGSHGGQFSFKENLNPMGRKFPFPVLGSVVNLLRKTTGASTTDLQNKRYNSLKNRIVTLAQYSDKVIFASGHEHSLQYIVEENTPQIVSGSGAKSGTTRLLNGSKFSSGEMGYAILDVYTDGSSRVNYYGLDDNGQKKFLYTSQVLLPNKSEGGQQYADTFPSHVKASIYNASEIDKSKFHKRIWGERYRSYYGTEVSAPTVRLDTLFGGLVPVRKGGGHQSKSLRLADKNGKEYVMRALRKSAELYLQSMAFKEQYIVGEFENTYTEGLLLDFYTGSHPYAPFTVDVLSDAVGLYHTNPVLYYVPKQSALKGYNDDFGDELYMIEEHVGDGHGELKSFGYANKVRSTDELFEKLRKDEKYTVDATTYVRARLFDMAVGDWDRHSDQWRWAEIKDEENGTVTFKPIPRDRDQVFSIMGDGPFMNVATRIIPGLRLMEGFKSEIRSVKGFNSSPKAFMLDMVLPIETSLEQWQNEAAYLQKELSEEVIDKAFEAFPTEIRDENTTALKRILQARLAKLPETAEEYYRLLNKFAVVTGTDKDDFFEVAFLENKTVNVKAYRIKGGKKADLIFQKNYDREITKEIWVYGLDDDDVFEVEGKNTSGIKVRLIGGQNNDTYNIESNKNVLVYDYKSKKNTFESTKGATIRLTDTYDVNTFQPKNFLNATNQLIPTIGYNPDDGVKIGFGNTYTFNGFRKNPFTQQHTVNASFYFATSGIELDYLGEFANVIGNWNLAVASRFTSPNFSRNFFGIGNETQNLDDALGMAYNRVRIQNLSFSPSLVWRGSLGGTFRTGISLERLSVEETEDRFVNTFYQANGEESNNSFLGVDAVYSFQNYDNAAFPTMGMATELLVGYKTSIDNNTRRFAYIVPSLSFDYKLAADGRMVLATKWKAHFNIGDDYEFYQAASIGGTDGLRGFRNQRFSGKTSYYQNTDVRYQLRKIKTGLLPVNLGVYGGFDYGRVWLANDTSDQWHTAYGGGFFLNGADVLTARVALFNSVEGPRFSFGVGFGF
ncbi:Hemolysin activation/secretion protein [Arenibacter nanhaiticus]|uniref:Hemolysin activation/secretion protein n=2 Tax=Arenibacter nanhaiticus TaxID=558155 RepID=A0A1M6I5J9_9FLAO|nr:Hemolysin activation/secretion protein [Arenibacter nanhaiticus]